MTLGEELAKVTMETLLIRGIIIEPGIQPERRGCEESFSIFMLQRCLRPQQS